jgi:hypothetical protein
VNLAIPRAGLPTNLPQSGPAQFLHKTIRWLLHAVTAFISAIRVTDRTLMSSSWPKFCAAVAMAAAVTGLQHCLNALEAEQLAVLVVRFGDAIG